MTYTWSASFVATPDTDNGLRRYTGQYINQFKAAMDERLSVEHDFNKATAAPQNDHGTHKAGSAVVYAQAAAPTVRPDAVTSLAAVDIGRMWVDTDDGLLKYWTGSAWAVVKAYPETGAITLGNITADDLDTGHGANDLYAMDQDVKTTDDITFNEITGNGLNGFNIYAEYQTRFIAGDSIAFTIPGDGGILAFSIMHQNGYLSEDYVTVGCTLSGRVISVPGASLNIRYRCMAVYGLNT